MPSEGKLFRTVDRIWRETMQSASDNPNITDNGISHMNLRELIADGNENITDRGISHMNLHTLSAEGNEKITIKTKTKLFLDPPLNSNLDRR